MGLDLVAALDYVEPPMSRLNSPPSLLVERLRDPSPLVGVELRPPRADLSYVDSMDT